MRQGTFRRELVRRSVRQRDAARKDSFDRGGSEDQEHEQQEESTAKACGLSGFILEIGVCFSLFSFLLSVYFPGGIVRAEKRLSHFSRILYLAGDDQLQLGQGDLQALPSKCNWRWSTPMSKASNWKVCASSQKPRMRVSIESLTVAPIQADRQESICCRPS